MHEGERGRATATRERTEDRGQKTEDRRQRTEDRGQKTEDRRQRTEDRGQKTKDRGQKTEDRRQRTEDRMRAGWRECPEQKERAMKRLTAALVLAFLCGQVFAAEPDAERGKKNLLEKSYN